jgi:signal transduction histidine kinase/CheY-like chemotaxis protein
MVNFPETGGYDVKTDTLSWDNQMYQLYDIDPDEFVGTYEYWSKLPFPSDFKILEQNLEERISLGADMLDGEIRVKTKEGEICYLRTRAKIFYDSEKQLSRLVGFNWDITKDKQMQEFLLDAKEKALSATQAKTSFLASMSHEIRTPMNGLIGMLDLLSETTLDDEQLKMVLAIQSCSESLLDIVNNVLDFSKIEAGKMELEHRAFELKNVLYSVRDIFSQIMKNKGLEFQVDISKNLPEFIVSDETRLKQILTNLLSNAIKFTDSGSIILGASLERVEENKKMGVLNFFVKDSGIGIDEEGQKKVFESFDQVDSSVTRKYGGTGLGLAICKSLVGHLGGQLDVESTIGKGSTFFFNIMAGIESSGYKKENRLNTQYDFIPNSLSILVAEDNEVNRSLAKAIFKKLEFDIEFAVNGEEAYDKVIAGSYDLVFMDLQMPNKDGITATKEIIEKLGDKSPKIIAMTANIFQEDRDRCFKSGMVGFVGKPAKKSDFAKIIAEHFPEKMKRKKINKLKELKMNTPHSKINFDKILFEFDGDLEIFEELIVQYKEGAPALINAIEEGVNNGSFKEVEIGAHTLKGVVSNFYYDYIQNLAFQMEKAGREEDLTHVPEILEEYRCTHEAMMDELFKFMNVQKAS